MREIKFRCKNKVGNWCFFTVLHNGNVNEENFDLETLSEFTGLLDKQGVEIYEGDIVKWGHLPNRNEFWHRVAFVEMFPCLQFHILHYIEGKTLEKKKGDNHIFGFSNFIYKDTHNSLEVIGNIYENKELLNENK